MWLGSYVAVVWCRLTAVAPIQPLAWEPPYAVGIPTEVYTLFLSGPSFSREFSSYGGMSVLLFIHSTDFIEHLTCAR